MEAIPQQKSEERWKQQKSSFAQTDEKPSGSSSAVNAKVNGEQDAQGEGNGSGGTAGQIAVSAPGGKAPPTAALVGANVPADAPAAVEKKDMELVIAADGDCWIRVRARERKTLYERTVRAGKPFLFQ